MDIVDALIGEHGALHALLDHAVLVARSGSPAEVLALIATLERVLLSHGDLEEELLFPALTQHRGRSEHEEIRTWLDVRNSPMPPATLLATAVDLARLHLEREEARLFPLARERIPAAERERLGALWAERRGVQLTRDRS